MTLPKKKIPLDDLDFRIIKCMAQAPHASQTTVAMALGVSKHVVAARLKNPLLLEALREAQNTTEFHLQIAAHRGAKRLSQLVDDPDKRLALDAIKVGLSPYINKSSVDIRANVNYETNIEPDGSLTRRVIEQELGMIASAAVNESLAETEENTVASEKTEDVEEIF